MFEIRTYKATASFCFSDLKTVIDLVRRNGEIPAKIYREFRQAFSLRIRVSVNGLQKMVSLVLILPNTLPNIAGNILGIVFSSHPIGKMDFAENYIWRLVLSRRLESAFVILDAIAVLG